jgi:hypothetical protein
VLDLLTTTFALLGWGSVLLSTTRSYSVPRTTPETASEGVLLSSVIVANGIQHQFNIRRRVMAVIPATSETRRRDLGGGAPDDAIPRSDPSSLPLLGMTPLA